MDKKSSGFKARWKARYHHASIQLILSIAFTAVAVIGMLFLGMALLLRFSSSANEMAAESSQRVLAQVNWNLDSYAEHDAGIRHGVLPGHQERGSGAE